MKTVVNRTPRPIKIRLRGGKVLHLGPGKEGRIADETGPGIKRLVEAGDIAILDERALAGSQSRSGSTGHAESKGHHPPTVVRPSGNR